MRIRQAESAQALLETIPGPDVPSLVLLDAELPGMPIAQLLAAVLASHEERRFPVVVIGDAGIPDWRDRLEEGILEDFWPRSMPPFHWRARVETVLRGFRHMRELEHLRGSTILNRETDPLTGLYNRTALVSMLFRETDRVQRLSTSLSIVRFDIEDFAALLERLGSAACEDLLKQAAGRVRHLLRTYDLFGRTGSAGFVLGLPGCSPVNSVCLAERIREEVFRVPFRAGTAEARLRACFGIAPSLGRSPLIVLREAEQALLEAKAAGREEIRCARDGVRKAAPAAFLCAPAAGDRRTR